MKKIAFLSCLELENMVVDDHLLALALKANGHSVQTIAWESSNHFSDFDLVLVRSPWNYMKKPTVFLEKLRQIASQTKLQNPLPLIEWNIHKKYLLELEKKGVEIVPTLLIEQSDLKQISIPKDWEDKTLILKPAISAGSYQTTKLTKDKIPPLERNASYLLQPFMPQIEQGEVSLIFFKENFSHAIIKKPKHGDFRVQEEFGGEITKMVPSDDCLESAQKILKLIPSKHLYARVDMIFAHGRWLLMELELIEPSLYFRFDEYSPKNFLLALDL